MKILFNKRNSILVFSTVILVSIGTLILICGDAYFDKTSVGKVEKVYSKILSAKPARSEATNNDKNIKMQLLDSIKRVKEDTKAEPVNIKKQEKLYHSVENQINVKKEEAKEIVKNKILDVYGDSLNTADMKIYFENKSISHPIGYMWAVNVIDKKNSIIYGCEISAMSGECTAIFKVDYKGLENPNDGSTITQITPAINQDKVNKYIVKAKDIVNKSKILISNNSITEDFTVKNQYYSGLRPVIELNAKTKNGQILVLIFYTDTDELNSIFLQY
jgi:hypothetical protein